jgi:hypothetical protein
MNLEKALLYEHSRNNAQAIRNYIGNNPALYAEVVRLYLENKGLLSQHAIWVLSLCTESYPHLALPHLSKLLYKLNNKEIDAASKRNTIRLLQFITVPAKFQGRVSDVCFQYLLDSKEQISVRVFSMTVLTNLCKPIPELKSELLLILEDQLPYGSAGFISRAKKSIRQLTR